MASLRFFKCNHLLRISTKKPLKLNSNYSVICTHNTKPTKIIPSTSPISLTHKYAPLLDITSHSQWSPKSAIFCRNMSSDSQDIPRKRSLPQLMSFPEIIWPSILKSIKNWIMVHFIIRPYMDTEFTLPDFNAGAKHALQLVSSKIAHGDISGLNGLVTSETITELQQSLAKMSMTQRTELEINKDDIFMSFPYQVGIMFDESNDKVQKRFVEITMVFHVLRGLREMQDKGIMPPLNLGAFPEYRDKICICNYRFLREFTQGAESDWTVNIVNHFKPSDYMDG